VGSADNGSMTVQETAILVKQETGLSIRRGFSFHPYLEELLRCCWQLTEALQQKVILYGQQVQILLTASNAPLPADELIPVG
jgi:hypothetical protein